VAPVPHTPGRAWPVGALTYARADLTLAVFEGCGAPDTVAELGCSSVYDVEQVEVAVEAGQTLTVLVEGFGPDDAGEFTLSAEPTP